MGTVQAREEGGQAVTDRDWERAPADEQRAELNRLQRTVKPCSECGAPGLIWNTLMAPLFCNKFRVSCDEVIGGCGRTTPQYWYHSGLERAIEEWNAGEAS
jgi:hypothetical protein